MEPSTTKEMRVVVSTPSLVAPRRAESQPRILVRLWETRDLWP